MVEMSYTENHTKSMYVMYMHAKCKYYFQVHIKNQFS